MENKKYFTKKNYEFISVTLKTRKGKLLLAMTIVSAISIFVTQSILGGSSMYIMIPCIIMILSTQAFANFGLEIKAILDKENEKKSKKSHTDTSDE